MLKSLLMVVRSSFRRTLQGLSQETLLLLLQLLLLLLLLQLLLLQRQETQLRALRLSRTNLLQKAITERTVRQERHGRRQGLRVQRGRRGHGGRIRRQGGKGKVAQIHGGRTLLHGSLASGRSIRLALDQKETTNVRSRRVIDVGTR